MSTQPLLRTRIAVTILFAAMMAAPSAKTRKPVEAPWHFAVSGDSRNCGNVVMPSIAAGAHANNAVFYWHLGDLRAIYDFDEDYRRQNPQAPIIEYLKS